MPRRRAALVIIFTLFSVFAFAKKNSDKPAPADENAIKVGVAVLKNSAQRSVPVSVERDRLVSAINHIKPPRHAKDAAKIVAIPLDSSSPEEANAQAKQSGCAYVVFTNLTDLRESGDQPGPLRPGEVRIGRDPVANDPNVAYRHETQRYAVMEFQLVNTDGGSPLFDTSASAHEATTEDGIVSMLMDRVANRVVSEIRNRNTRPPME
ncbi:MAG TPA: hypothetical protein VE994_21065 [Terriglobales bacterium]|nr:hypothetical protein [Terriglobales bacterium]